MSSSTPVDPVPQLLSRVATTRTAQEQAVSVHEQAIRDAKSAGHPVTQIASALGVANRARLYAVLDRTLADPDPPTLTPVVFLRGARVPGAVWQAVEIAMHRRGLATVKDRQQAWTLARGGVPVVLADFSAGSQTALVGTVKARWKIKEVERTVSHLLPRKERDRLAALGENWLDVKVVVEERNAELPLMDPNAVMLVRNDPLDPDEFARAVATQLA